MKVICLLCDSLNRHFLQAYGNKIADTPNLDWFASQDENRFVHLLREALEAIDCPKEQFQRLGISV